MSIRKITKIIGGSVVGIVLLWGTFWTIIVFDSKYHVLNLFQNKSFVLAKGGDIPSFNLCNYHTKERVNSVNDSWGKNLFVFFDPDHSKSWEEISYLENMVDVEANKNLKIFIISTSDSLGFCNWDKAKQKSKLWFWRLTSKLPWKYRLMPTIWYVENGRLTDLQEGFLSCQELEDQIRSFVHPDSPRHKAVVYSLQNWSRIIPPKDACNKAWSSDQVRQLFSKTVSQGSVPVSTVALIWSQKDSSLFWQVELVDRVCDCKGLPAGAFNLAKVKMNPIDGQIVSSEIIEAIPEKDFKQISE
ncbi:MAG: hypothetical protein WCE90_04795 [Candidatus Zixiibacteriota bacterium]